MDLTFLTKTSEPWLHQCSGTANDIADTLCQWELAAPGKRRARIVRGRKSMTEADFYDEVAAALQFPGYFGENWDALSDCLRDWNWFPAQAAIAICITEADILLSSTPAKAAVTLAKILTRCVQEVNSSSRQLQKPQPLHVLFQCAPPKVTAMAKRWHEAGLELAHH